MSDTNSEAAAFRLQCFSRSDVFNIGIQSVVETATKRLLSKFKGNEKRLGEFLSEVECALLPFNQGIPECGSGISKMDAQEPQGTAMALTFALISESDDFLSFVRGHGKGTIGKIKVCLAALALSKPSDNRGAIDLVLGTISNIEHSKKSTTGTKIAKTGVRPKKCPLKAYMTEIIGENPEESAKYLLCKAIKINYVFKFNKMTLSMTVAETEPLGVDWEAVYNESRQTFKIGKMAFDEFEKLCSDIRRGK